MRLNLIILFVVIPFFIKGQIIDPITKTATPSRLISDFGPRNILPANGSVFHGGLDLGVTGNNYIGFPAYAVETGDINTFYFGTRQDSYIQVGIWRYMHIFVGTTDDGLWEYNSSLGLLIIKDNQGNVIRAYAPWDRYPKADYEGVTVLRSFTQGDLVFRAGPYDASAPHLHIDRGRGSWENPYSFLPRVETGPPTLSYSAFQKAISVPTDDPLNDKFFVGSNVYNSVILTYGVTTGDHDFDNLVLSISTDQVNFNNLTRWHYTNSTGDGVLDLTDVQYTGGRATGISATPKDNIRFSNYGSERETDILEGIYPVDNLAGYSNRERFKYKWNTQQTIAGSRNVLNYKYPDGDYYIQVIASDIAGNQSVPILHEVNVDNFLPYIEKVEIRKDQSEGELVYTGEWSWDNSTSALKYSLNNLATIKANTPLFIRVYASESMSNINLSAFGYSKNNYTPVANTNRKVWQFPIPSSMVTSGNQTITIYSNSSDVIGNGLQGFTSKSPLMGSSIPVHQVDYRRGTWSKPISTWIKDDIIHTIEVIAAPLTTPINVKATTNQSDKITISWDAVTDSPYYNVYRADETMPITSITGSTWITATSFNDVNVTAGKNYDYWVKSAKSSGGLEESSLSKKVAGSLLGLTTDPPTCDFTMDANQIIKGKSVTFTDASKNNPTSWDWTFFGGSPSSSSIQNPVVRYDNVGSYAVNLQVSNANGSSSVLTKLIKVVDAQYTISGKADVNFTLHSGVTVTFDPGGTTTTDSYGNYSYDLPDNWTGVIKASKYGFSFIDVAVNSLSSNRTIDLHGTPVPKYKIIMTPSNPSGGETVQFSLSPGTGTGYDGIWDFGDGSVIFNDHGVLTPEHIFYCNLYDNNTFNVTCIITKQDGSETYEAQNASIYIPLCTQITPAAKFTNGCSTIKQGQEAYITDISEPYGKMQSLQIEWVAGESERVRYYTPLSEYYANDTHYPIDRQFSHLYSTKGHKSVEWIAFSDYVPYYSWFGVNVVDCNSTVYSNNLSNCTFDNWAGIERYWAGTIILAGSAGVYEVNPDKKTVFSSCNEIILKPGFHAKLNNDNFLQLTSQDFCISGNQNALIPSNYRDEPILRDKENINIEQKLTIYPNPTSNTINLEYTGDVTKVLSIGIFNSSGKLMLEQTDGFVFPLNLNVAHFSPGAYCIRLRTSNEVLSKVFIKS